MVHIIPKGDTHHSTAPVNFRVAGGSSACLSHIPSQTIIPKISQASIRYKSTVSFNLGGLIVNSPGGPVIDLAEEKGQASLRTCPCRGPGLLVKKFS